MNSRLSSLLALKSQSARPIRPESFSTSEETFISSKPGNELEGLIRDKLPDSVRRHLTMSISIVLMLRDSGRIGRAN